MAKTVEEVLEQAKLYGYHITMSNSNYTWYGLHHDRFPIHLDLYPTTEEFCLTNMQGIIQITTGKCGSFMNESHFLGIQHKLLEIIMQL